jgi:polyisoprenoid-binding protein YceI
MIKRAALALVFCCAISDPASAKNWAVDYANSKLGFTGTQGSSSFSGSFKIFQAVIDFDPDHPETGKINTSIDMTSATAGSPERDGYLPQPDWFDSQKFAAAQFVSTSIRKTGDHTYIADGTLTIKGVTQPVSLPFTLVQEGDHWRAQGKVTLLRSDFHVGTGEWASESYVKYAVDVTVNLSAKP